MRVLLDEHIPRKLKWRFKSRLRSNEPVEVITVPERGWNGLKNGALLRKTAPEFDVLVTMDTGIKYQQNLRALPLGFILLSAPTNQYADLLPLMAQTNEALDRIQPGDIVEIGPAR